MILSSEQFDLIIEIQRKQLQVLERLSEMVIQQVPLPCSAAMTPHYYYPLDDFKSFDWESIGAKVEQIDSSGPSVISWWGRQFVKRTLANKFGESIWFSRCVGVGADGQNQYERIITFGNQTVAAEPLPQLVMAPAHAAS